MKRQKKQGLDFVVDKLTNSIENVVSGDSFSTDITLIESQDLKTITKKNEWQFDWKLEFKQPNRDVYKLTIVNNQFVIQGLISLEIKSDHVYMHLVESAPFNKGKMKIYAGVPGNLVAFACKLSFERGYDGYLAFDAKTALVKHYEETLYATHFKGTKMIIETPAAVRLINQYFKNQK